MGGHGWRDHQGIAAVAAVMSQSLHAYHEILRLCLTIGAKFGYGDQFMASFRKTLRFIRGSDDDVTARNELQAGFDQIAQTYREAVAEGMEQRDATNGIMSALCENLTHALLLKKQQRSELVKDAIAFDGHKRIPPKNTANLDVAAATQMGPDTYWEVFECKQAPSGFYEPYLWQNHIDPTRRDSWRRSQVRLAVAILEVGAPFAMACVVSYRPPADVVNNMSRLAGSTLPDIPCYDRAEAWEKLPWCQLPRD